MESTAAREAARLNEVAIGLKRAGCYINAQHLYEIAVKIDPSDERVITYHNLGKVLAVQAKWGYAVECFMISTVLAFSGYGDVDAALNNLGHCVLGNSLEHKGRYSFSDLIVGTLTPAAIDFHLDHYRNAARGLGSQEKFEELSLPDVLHPQVLHVAEKGIDLKSLPPFLEPGVTTAVGLFYFSQNEKPFSTVAELEKAYIGDRVPNAPEFGSAVYRARIKELGVPNA